MALSKQDPIQIFGIEWRQLSEDGLGGIELILETDYKGFRQFESAITGVHRTSISGGPDNSDKMQVSQPVLLRVVNIGTK